MSEGQMHDYAAAGPEIFLAVAAMALLMLGVFRGTNSTRLVAWLAVAAFAVAFVWVLSMPAERTVTFAGGFIVDGFSRFAKLLVLLGSGFALVMSLDYIRQERMERFEYPVLFVLATPIRSQKLRIDSGV